MNLLISAQTQWIGLSIAGTFLLFGISIIIYAIRTAECYELEDDVPGKDMEPCNYADIQFSERPYIDHQYN